MIAFYTPVISNRLQYILDFLQHEVFGAGLQVFTDDEQYRLTELPGINYSDARLREEEVWIKPTGLLFETGIKNQDPQAGKWDDTITIFPVDGDIPFDLPAACFYLLSRYEEYLSFKPDRFGRYNHTNSLAFQKGFLEQPLIDTWLNKFRLYLNGRFHQHFIKPNFRQQVSFDIDVAFAFLGRGRFLNLAAYLKLFMTLRFGSIHRRYQVQYGQRKDPYDIYEWLEKLLAAAGVHPIFFFLVGERISGKDRNTVRSNNQFKQLIADAAEAGLHPSWSSAGDVDKIRSEREWLHQVTGLEIFKSRQHYIHLKFPSTYRSLMDAGIKEDYSMGYPTINGFRSSFSRPFTWYDLEAETQTTFLIVPFCFMDSNAVFISKQTPSAAYDELMRLYNSVKQEGGSFVSVWHNNNLADLEKTRPWKQMFEKFIAKTFRKH